MNFDKELKKLQKQYEACLKKQKELRKEIGLPETAPVEEEEPTVVELQEKLEGNREYIQSLLDTIKKMDEQITQLL